jgi:hypothetical protein
LHLMPQYCQSVGVNELIEWGHQMTYSSFFFYFIIFLLKKMTYPSVL